MQRPTCASQMDERHVTYEELFLGNIFTERGSCRFHYCFVRLGRVLRTEDYMYSGCAHFSPRFNCSSIYKSWDSFVWNLHARLVDHCRNVGKTRSPRLAHRWNWRNPAESIFTWLEYVDRGFQNDSYSCRSKSLFTLEVRYLDQ